MTWKELSDKISSMTQEEQQQDVAIWGEDFCLRKHCALEKNSEDMFYNILWDECIPKSDLEDSDLDDPSTKMVYEAGKYYIFG